MDWFLANESSSGVDNACKSVSTIFCRQVVSGQQNGNRKVPVPWFAKRLRRHGVHATCEQPCRQYPSPTSHKQTGQEAIDALLLILLLDANVELEEDIDDEEFSWYFKTVSLISVQAEGDPLNWSERPTRATKLIPLILWSDFRFTITRRRAQGVCRREIDPDSTECAFRRPSMAVSA